MRGNILPACARDLQPRSRAPGARVVARDRQIMEAGTDGARLGRAAVAAVAMAPAATSSEERQRLELVPEHALRRDAEPLLQQRRVDAPEVDRVDQVAVFAAVE